MNKFLISLLSIFGLHAHASDYSEYERHTYENTRIDASASLPYRVLLPDNFDENTAYPLVLFLHGAGERGNDNVAQLTHGASMFLSPEFKENYPAVVVFPQAALNDYWVNVDVNRESSPIEFHFKSGAEKTVSMKLLSALVDELRAKPYVDKTNVLVMGLSMGGMGTYDIIASKPGVFKAAVAICGGGHPDLAMTITSTPVWAFHGEDDEVVPLSASKTMVDAINAEGGSAKLTIYPNTGHNSWDDAFAEPELFPWLFSHLK
jgi:predicted peptidase